MPTPQLATSHEGLIEHDGRSWYAIPDLDRLDPFLMSVVSDGDRWMFASSAGGLTAGRRDASHALFPYETDDRLHQAGRRVGAVTSMRISGDLWRPFDPTDPHPNQRRLLKSVEGDALVREEHDPAGRVLLATRWASCDEFGFVRTATLRNDTESPLEIDLVDGLVGVMPYGLDPSVTQRLSNLSNAYRRSEVIDDGTRCALFTLESPVSDQPEPEEVLRANTVWSVGLDGASLTLDAAALRAFDRGETEPVPASLITGRPGAYLLRRRIVIDAGASLIWHIVADVARDHRGVVALRRRLAAGELAEAIDEALADATAGLTSIMARGDGQQLSGDTVESAHHLANTTYNVMRGGIPLDGYRLSMPALRAFLAARNRQVVERHRAWIDSLPPAVERRDLLELVAERDDPHLERLAGQYLPFSFSRRHGDPSRPWNAFSIRVRDEAGEPVVYYEGNWRDVFQNWEALCAGYPDYLPGVVSVFLDASTADGYNPYRITSDGIDWEVPDPDDPWANIGYWGDHQLVYLLRLLDAADRYDPGVIGRMAVRRRHTYAAVPYRIAPYDDLVRDPKSTIDFDDAADARTETLVGEIGADGKLVLDEAGAPVLVTMLEKLLVTTLSKLSNFVPGGGVWMNTQRPEWNDANNALVGYGVSMVTLCHLRSFLVRLRDLAAGLGGDVEVSAEVAAWADTIRSHLVELRLISTVDDPDRYRRHVMDQLGGAFSVYRTRLYERGLSGSFASVRGGDVVGLCDAALVHVDDTILAAQRSDGLYHSYSLLRFADAGVAVDDLSEMLEGQVAVLGTGLLSATERADLLDALYDSALYRADQHSFMLYPVRTLPSFPDKNIVPAAAVAADPLLAALAAADDAGVLRVDGDGVAHFHPDLVDAPHLAARLDELASEPQWADLIAEHRGAALDAFEAVFGHTRFTGRSGSMYAYEGIGSIYWHMVAKLLLAAQESVRSAVDEGADDTTVERLVAGYWRVRDGLGAAKTAEEFGAVPTDPYSHTPAHAGAQQPGMTGAVKEELLARWLELGIRVEAGEIVVDPMLVRDAELLVEPTEWVVDTLDGPTVFTLDVGSLGFTFCRVPFVVSRGEPSIEVVWHDGRVEHIAGTRLGRSASAEVFGHTGAVSVVRISA